MYPLADGLFAPLNRWYVAAWSEEITRAPMERWLFGQPVVMYRRTDGSVVALEGRCPHRHFPLAKGKVIGDNLQCAYHGITFGPDGRCVRVPTQSFAPAACRTRSYPVAQRGLWVWIWPGDATLADTARIPETEIQDAPAPAFSIRVREYRHVKGRYMLLHDNLLDLSHLEYLHAAGIGSAGAAGVREQRSEGEDWVRSERQQTDAPCPPHFQELLAYRGPVTRRFGMTCHVPALHIGFDEFERAAAGPGEPLRLGGFRVWHAITPGRSKEAHYFVAAGRDFAPDDAALDAGMRQALSRTLDEDVMATESIEALIESLPERPRDILVQGDATCVRGRRLFESMIRAESKTAD